MFLLKTYTVITEKNHQSIEFNSQCREIRYILNTLKTQRNVFNKKRQFIVKRQKKCLSQIQSKKFKESSMLREQMRTSSQLITIL